MTLCVETHESLNAVFTVAPPLLVSLLSDELAYNIRIWVKEPFFIYTSLNSCSREELKEILAQTTRLRPPFLPGFLPLCPPKESKYRSSTHWNICVQSKCYRKGIPQSVIQFGIELEVEIDFNSTRRHWISHMVLHKRSSLPWAWILSYWSLNPL